MKDGEYLKEGSPYRNYNAVCSGEVDSDEMRAVYAENIEYVMEALERLIDSIDGKIVITSDHGELLGERFTKWKRWLDNRWGTDWDRYTWGHYRDINVPELVEVPWLELPSDSD